MSSGLFDVRGGRYNQSVGAGEKLRKFLTMYILTLYYMLYKDIYYSHYFLKVVFSIILLSEGQF